MNALPAIDELAATPREYAGRSRDCGDRHPATGSVLRSARPTNRPLAGSPTVTLFVRCRFVSWRLLFYRCRVVRAFGGVRSGHSSEHLIRQVPGRQTQVILDSAFRNTQTLSNLRV